MTLNYIARTVFLSCMLAFAGVAHADIVKCLDETGTVTYTNVSCQNGEGVARASAGGNISAVKPEVSSREDTFAATGDVRGTAWVNKSASVRTVALDVATLRAAKSSMLLMDQASSLLRQQKLAALDQKGQRWFNF